jgi:hypothetical protein
VYAHADAQVGVTRPRVFGQCPLSVDGRGHGVRSAPEGNKEGVALSVDLLPSVLCEGGP